MTRQIFKSILSVAVTILVATVVIITGFLYQYFGNVQKTQLKDELYLAAAATEKLGESYLEDFENYHYRLTWIDEAGTVLYDNQAMVEQMENHADREEISSALATGRGSSTRYSTTLTEQNIYEAVRLSDGSVLRISESRFTPVVLVLGMMQPIALLLLAAILLSVWLAKKMAGRVVEPFNQLNLDRPLENEAYEELSPLLRRVHAQQVEIRKQMGNLKHQQEEFEQITKNVKEALLLLDPKGRIVSINPAACAWFGAECQKGDNFLRNECRENMRGAIEEAKVHGNASLREKKGEQEFQFELSSISSEANIYGIVILGFDVTEQVNAEQSRKEFTANVSHELKTPLQSIIGSAELLENGIVKREDVPRFVGHIHREAERLLSLIDDIIRLSQLDEGNEMSQEEVSLKLLSEEVCEALADIARKNHISLEVTGDMGALTGVRRLLYEIIYNLCDNGIKYNESGGSVKIIIEETEEDVCLSVQDTGIGIAHEHLEKIFERFYRVDKSHSKQSGGTGLGLSIVKHAVQYHNGKLDIESEPGKGTKIYIHFYKAA